jgi:hypothetical protein
MAKKTDPPPTGDLPETGAAAQGVQEPDTMVWARPLPHAVGTTHKRHGLLRAGVPVRMSAEALAASTIFGQCDPPAVTTDERSTEE